MSGERRKRKPHRGSLPQVPRPERPEIPGVAYILNAVGVLLIALAVLSGAAVAVDVACFVVGFGLIAGSAVFIVRTGALGFRGMPGQYHGGTGGDGGGHHGGGDVGGALGGYVGGDFGGGGGHGGGGHGG